MGGGISSSGKIYGFPRSAGSLLEITPNTDKIREIGLKRSIYSKLKRKLCKDHHYGGCIIGELAFLAPRNHNTIMVVDVNTGVTEEIETPKGLRFSGVTYHPNGCIYFVPDKWSKCKKRIMKYNPLTKEISLFKDTISGSCFGLIVHPKDSCIYSFSAYSAGLLKIDVKNETAKMLHKEIGTGWYGTKLGWNGKLYSVCGNNTNVIEYDPLSDHISTVGKINDKEGWMDFNEAKCAGGAVLSDGSIVTVPALGRHIYIYRFEKFKASISSNIYTSVFYNNY